MYDSFTAEPDHRHDPAAQYRVPPPNQTHMHPPREKHGFRPQHAQGGKDEWAELLTDLPKLDLGVLRDELEGPKPLRAIATICGLAMAAAAGLQLINIPRAITHPAEYAVEANMLLFGLSVVLIESKTLSHKDRQRKSFIHQWFPFLSIVGGKGLAYIFFGSLGLSFGLKQMLSFATGGAMTLMGVIYCLIQFAHNDTLAQKYDHSVYLSHFPA